MGGGGACGAGRGKGGLRRGQNLAGGEREDMPCCGGIGVKEEVPSCFETPRTSHSSDVEWEERKGEIGIDLCIDLFN